MVKVRHWHSKQAACGMLEGLQRGRANVLLSIVWDFPIVHLVSGKLELQIEIVAPVKLHQARARKFRPANVLQQGSGRPAGKPQVFPED